MDSRLKYPLLLVHGMGFRDNEYINYWGRIPDTLSAMGCDCAILACTELSVFRAQYGLPPYYVDAMEVLAEEAVVRCGKTLKKI